MNNFLITGGCGFIGSNFCNYIINNVNKLVIVDKISYSSSIEYLNKDVIKKSLIIKEDIININLEKIINDNDINYVIHFAAQTHVDNSYKSFNEFINDNIISTQVLCEEIYKYNKKYNKSTVLLHFSTDEVYGPSENNIIFNETSNFNPTNPYSATKACSEMIINTYKYSYNMPIIITRCNNVYGKNQHYEKVIPCFINKALNNDELPIHGDGNKVRDFIHCDDVNNAIKIIIEKGEIGEIYNIGINNPIKINDLANKIINIIGKGNIKYIQNRPFNDYRYIVDTSKLEKLGWKPNINFDDGLNDVINWIKERNVNIKSFNDIIETNCKEFNDKRGVIQFIPINKLFRQQFITLNHKNVLRGIHTSPYGKVITCLNGSFIDYIIDFNTLTYKKYFFTKNMQLYVPPHCGHCYVTLEDNSTMLYQLEGVYNECNEKNYNYKCPYINLDISSNINYIISDKDKNHPFYKNIDYIVLGSTGFLGEEICKILKNDNKNYISINTRLEEVNKIKELLLLYKPKYVICAAGISGKPSVSWCETNKIETLETNITYQLTLANICNNLNIHLTLFVSGLLYKDGIFSEEDIPNNYDLYYSQCRILLEKCLEVYNNILLLRIMYPISFTDNPKCFLNKIISRKNNIHDIEINSTIIPSLFPLIPNMIEMNKTGIYNFVNNGVISIKNICNYLEKNNNMKFNLIEYKSNIGFLNINKLKSLFNIEDINTYFK